MFCMYYVSFVVGDIVVGWGEVECSVQELLADWGVEFFDVKVNKAVVLFVLRASLHGGGGPQVDEVPA